jgi:hypothetical protein
MNRTEYKNNFGREHYERINLVVPKGMKDIIKVLASSKGMSVNAYMQDLVRKDQCGLFDTMQIAEKNRDMISGITGNMHDGYDIIFKDGHSCHCRTKKDVRSCTLNTATKRAIDSSFFYCENVSYTRLAMSYTRQCFPC